MAYSEPTRLFDLVDYQLARFPLPDMLAAVEEGSWRRYATQEVKDTAQQLAAAFHHCGIGWQDGTSEGRNKVAVISGNRPEWIILDLAVQQAGAVLVPIYPTVHAAELQYILDHAGVSILFVENNVLAQKAAALMPMLPGLKSIYTFEKTGSFRHWQYLLEKHTPADIAAVQDISRSIQPTDLATIIYTSGTTGTPKGVMLSHRNILSDVISCHPLVADVGIEGDKVLSFLPLNHAFERCANYLYFYSGASVYYAQSTATIAEDLRYVQPVLFTTVPRLLEKVYETILSKGAQLTGIKKNLFDWSVRLAEQYEINTSLPLTYRAQLALADKLIFNKWRAAMGGRVKAVITGAAACQVKLLRSFSAAGIVIMEGYGLTEAAPVVSGNRYPAKGRKFGTVGPPLENIEVDFAADGELLIKGANVMMGYYKKPDQTAEVLRDGWLYTGDIAVLEEGKFLKITDRKKELFKTSGGKYVAPQPIENSMVQSRWIEQMMVTGAGEKFVSALIVPAFNAIKEWYAAKGQSYPGNDVAVKDEAIHKIIQKEVQQFNQHFNPVEQVKKFLLLPSEWTIETGELTHTLKLKRRQILEKYGHLVAQLYA
ncbi:long-chain acyl-CoA synthetase [Cnuella takakiae]|uniref:Long-chain acyl-CoA synthetase n=1 Tax=Cnuella takakiae TaxID=1302690 RepID=A0A1M4Y0P8_9BACT|nr:long-chain fatty acid--CoA ligase [Cnuella takakiae]OLY93006.1 long-chain fatty acid--CoA ligase [Cnuella takakiae]SHE99268.1 long-chain acyl-CoA synthetase [Cnuella takakiae]